MIRLPGHGPLQPGRVERFARPFRKLLYWIRRCVILPLLIILPVLVTGLVAGAGWKFDAAHPNAIAITLAVVATASMIWWKRKFIFRLPRIRLPRIRFPKISMPKIRIGWLLHSIPKRLRLPLLLVLFALVTKAVEREFGNRAAMITCVSFAILTFFLVKSKMQSWQKVALGILLAFVAMGYGAYLGGMWVVEKLKLLYHSSILSQYVNENYIGYALTIGLFLGMTAYAYFQIRKTYKRGTGINEGIWKRIKSACIVLLALAAIVFGLWDITYSTGHEGWWQENVLPHSGMIVLIAVLLFVLPRLIKPGTVPFKYRLIWPMKLIGMVILIILIVKVWHGDKAEAKVTPSPPVILPPLVTTSAACPPGSGDAAVLKAESVILRDYPDLRAFAGRESCHEQWKKNHLGFRLMGESLVNPDSTATGVLQIIASNAVWCALKDPTATVDTIEGNLKCGVLIHDDDAPGHGPDAWHGRPDTSISFDVPLTTEWSTIRLPKQPATIVSYHEAIPVLASFDGKPAFVDRPGEFHSTNTVKTVQYRQMQSPTVVRFTYTYR